MRQLDARIGRGEAPVDLHFLSIACLLPGSHLLFQMGLIANTWLQGMSSEDREFNLGPYSTSCHAWACSEFPVSRRAALLPLAQRPRRGRFITGNPPPKDELEHA